MKLKIKNNEEIFIPEERINLVNYGYIKNVFIEYMQKYCSGKKNANCNLFDDNGEIVKNKDIVFINVTPNIVFDGINFNKKSMLKEYVVNCVLENEELFLSVNSAIEKMKEIYTDNGFIKLLKILNCGMKQNIELSKDNMTIESFISLIDFVIVSLPKDDSLIFFLNLVKAISQNCYLVIYISGFEITQHLLNYLNMNNQRISYLIEYSQISDCAIFNNVDVSILVNNNYGPVYLLQKNENEKKEYIYSLLDSSIHNFDFQISKVQENILELTNIKDNYMIKFYLNTL